MFIYPKIARLISHIPKRAIFSFCTSSQYFSESREFWRPPSATPKLEYKSPESVEDLLLDYLLEHCPKNNPLKTLEFIDKYCLQSWMMNIGPEKRKIFEKVIAENKVRSVLEIGTYCGYSAIAISQTALQPDNKIVTLQINKKVAEIAKKIIAHSGVKNIMLKTENIYEANSFLNETGPFDLVFMDQEESDYMKDLHFLQQRNLIRTGAIIIADNILYPGSPDYLSFMQQQSKKKKYRSILYHTYDAYSDVPDAVLVSRKIY